MSGEQLKTWRERIVDARVRGAFTDADIRLAADWKTCAVGEQCQKGLIVDPFINVLDDPGVEFVNAVSHHRPDVAEDILDRIEDIALQLKRDAALAPSTVGRSATTGPAQSPQGAADLGA